MTESPKAAVIVGGTGGLGYAIAVELAASHESVFLFDLDAEAGHEAAQRLRDECSPVRTGFIQCDVSNAGSVARAFEKLDDVLEGPEGIDVLVNSAGIREIRSIAELEPAEWDQVIGVNLSGSFYCIKQAMTRMTPGASVVNVASVSGLIGMANRSAYTASKHGVVGLTKSLARDLGSIGIRVNAVAPGTVRTPMTEAYYHDEEFTRVVEGAVPLGFECSPADVAGAVAYLCSDSASYVNGVVLPVDGGWLAEKNYAPGAGSAAYAGTADASPVTNTSGKADNHG